MHSTDLELSGIGVRQLQLISLLELNRRAAEQLQLTRAGAAQPAHLV